MESEKRYALDRNAMRATMIMNMTGAITRIAAIWTTTRTNTGRTTAGNGGMIMIATKMFAELREHINKRLYRHKIIYRNSLPLLYLTLYNIMVVILAWNVRGIMSSTICLSNLLDTTKCDIAVISEHKMKNASPCGMNIDSLHGDYRSIAKVSDDDISKVDNTLYFTGKGGIALLIKKSIEYSCKEVSCMDSNRIVGVELRDSNGNMMYIFCVYLPADGDIENYSYEIGLLESLYTYYSIYGNVVIAGDMNSSCISKLNTNSSKSDILSFMNRCDICLPGKVFLIDGC